MRRRVSPRCFGSHRRHEWRLVAATEAESLSRGLLGRGGQGGVPEVWAQIREVTARAPSTAAVCGFR
jgi:hypothetical protein